ncbi:MAG TPA: hypothetical protein ENG80_05190 [Nitrospirae bacterium]|nr:hypothetical protein BMS3Abin10_00881 [bacterium BMS3Abin10]GBE39978.1 hypothetical protein BMS3Bbin08_02614 [bacterium BMS3Bbin08]HDH01185.1 hypothetical protein [Nitrospirota bacterium]HDH50516.1 hypothetical protein [Nitrospirota bacterium]HDK81069.1 hypothetical protein [Nitrospirota bacterium]
MNRSDLKNGCVELLNALQGVLSLEWDDRFETTVAEFSVDNKDRIREILERYLGFVWDSSSIKKAPDIVRAINDDLDGLRPRQLFFASDPDQEVFIFCAWWPWGNGESISVRFAPAYKNPSGSQKAELTKLFKDLLRV